MSEQTPPDDRPTGPVAGAHPDVDELSAYVDGELDTARAREVGAHVAACAGCTDDLRALRLVAAELAALPAPTMPADVAARLDEAIARERGAQPARGGDVLPGKRRASPGWATGAAAAVAVGLLAVIGIGALSKMGGGDMKPESGSAPAAQRDSAAEAAPTAVYFSGTEYSQERLERQLAAVISRPAPAAADPGLTALDSNGKLFSSSSAAPMEPSGARLKAVDKSLVPLATEPGRLSACVKSIDPTIQPLAVDFGRYGGEPVVVVALPNDPGLLDVYVAGADCGVGGEDHVITWQLVRQSP
jgi:anti-sigma factor RsiW